MSRGHKLDLLDGTAKCRCGGVALYVASYLRAGPRGEIRIKFKYCQTHALAFAAKYNLAEWRGDALHIAQR